MQQKIKTAELSIVITAHAEGILLHKTLASVHAALTHLENRHVVSEIIIHCDNPTQATTDYINAHKQTLSTARIYTNSFGDLGLSRNFAVHQAHGKYVSFIDADDLVSEYWFVRAYEFLESKELGAYVAHSETTVEFGGMDAVILKHGSMDQATDTLLSVYANRWNAIIMAPRELLLKEPYTANGTSFGYEDWHLNTRLIARGIHHQLIPETAIFVRRKATNSEWLRQQQVMAVLARTPLFTFSRIRKLHNPLPPISPSSPTGFKLAARNIAGSLPGGRTLVRGIYVASQRAQRHIRPTKHHELPKWLIQGWAAMHRIERAVFLRNDILAHPPYYDSLTPEHYQAGNAFKRIVDCTRYDNYDYLFFVPWLKSGGADKFTLQYANFIQKLHPEAQLAVISTLHSDSPWRTKLDSLIDFIPFGEIAHELGEQVKNRLLEQFVENSGAQYLHIINSELAYDFVQSHAVYIRATQKHIIVTSFSESADTTGRVFGYSHTHVPKIYDLVSVITTDNQPVVRMWENEYGFDPKKLLVHHQLVDIPDRNPKSRDPKQLHVLWAARLSPEKQPTLVVEIAKLVAHEGITIDMYGVIDEGFDTSFLQSLPPNMRYRGNFDGFYTLPLEGYDAYLYTSLFDGMPNAILEAASASLPIVSSAVGGVSDFITNDKDGFTIAKLDNAKAYAKALLELQQKPELRPMFTKNLLKKLEHEFSAEAYEKQIRAFLKKIDFMY